MHVRDWLTPRVSVPSMLAELPKTLPGNPWHKREQRPSRGGAAPHADGRTHCGSPVHSPAPVLPVMSPMQSVSQARARHLTSAPSLFPQWSPHSPLAVLCLALLLVPCPSLAGPSESAGEHATLLRGPRADPALHSSPSQTPSLSQGQSQRGLGASSSLAGRRRLDQSQDPPTTSKVGMVEKFEAEVKKQSHNPEKWQGWGAEAGEGERGMEAGILKKALESHQKRIQELTQEIETLKQATGSKGDPEVRLAKPSEVFVFQQDDPPIGEQRKFQTHGYYGYIQYSSYRISPSRFTIIGIGRNKIQSLRQAGGCYWIDNNGTYIEGHTSIHYANDTHPKAYELVVLDCQLNTGWADDGEDGFAWSRNKGFLKVMLDQEEFYPYKETQGYKVHKMNALGPFQYQMLMCGPPLYGKQSLPAILQWISYHRALGFDHFVFYDAGALDGAAFEALRPLMEAGLVTVQEYRGALLFEAWMQGQHVALNDCLLRSREIAQWVALMDVDEYLDVPAGKTLVGIINEHNESSYITNGCYTYDVDHCEAPDVFDPNTDKFAVELLLHRAQKPFCEFKQWHPFTDEYCIMGYGHRKQILNPRKVLQVNVHHSERFLAPGTDLHISELNHGHYRGLQVEGRPCHPEKVKEAQRAGFHQFWFSAYNITDGGTTAHGVAEAAQRARECAKANFDDKEKCLPKL